MRVVSADEAVAGIASRQQVFVHGGAATPAVLLDALVRRAAELEEVGIIHFHTEGPAPHLAPEMAGHFRHRALFIGANAREAVNDGRADYVPVFLSDVPELFQTGVLPLDAVLLNLTPPDEHGFCSLGTSVDAALAAAHSARTVIAQLNPLVPRTLGDSFIHVSEIDMAVEVDQPPYEHIDAPIGDVERRIGENVAEIVPDRATLQMGIGSIPAAVALALRDKRDLGAHTELFTDVILDLVQSGALTGAAKEINRGKIVTAFLMGSRRLYHFVDDNPMVEMRPVDYTNDTSVIRRFSRMVAVNSAISIDLTGQVSADSIGTRFYSGVGGQMDFMRGAGGPRHHRSAVHGRRRQGVANLCGAARGCRRGHEPGARAYRGHGVRDRRAVRPQRARTRPCPDRHRPSGLPGRAPPPGPAALPPRRLGRIPGGVSLRRCPRQRATRADPAA
jgi:4-hydroxybutyrate CoA-transferase